MRLRIQAPPVVTTWVLIVILGGIAVALVVA